MRSFLGRLGHVIVQVSAASFWAIGGTLLILSLLELVPWGRWLEAGRLLKGSVAVIEPARLVALENSRREYQEIEKRRGGDPAYVYIRRALDRIDEEEERSRSELDAERTRLVAWQNELTKLQARITDDIDRWKQQRSELRVEVEQARTAVLSEADRRVLNIYRQMEASLVADDLTSLFTAGDTEGAVRILDSLPERQAAEALAEVEDPQVRVALLNEMRTIAEQRVAGLAPEVSQVGAGGTP